MNLSDQFGIHGYKVVPALVRDPVLARLRAYALRIARRPQLARGDIQVPNTPAVYGDPVMDSLLRRLIPRVQAESGRLLYPTYSYFRIYKSGDVLAPHKDRYACEISLSMSLGYEPDEPWPFWVDSGGGSNEIRLQPGDAVLYKGLEVRHWREAFHGNYSAQVFLHYVDRNGPYSNWKFDRRPALGTAPVQ